jgi:DNA-binding transcriptional ArsR family regulator
VAQRDMTPAALSLVAERFKALSESARLQILSALRRGERTVGDLVEETGLGQANVSKHLQLLHTLAFVSRRKDGPFVYYELADATVFQLCDLMCKQLESHARARHQLLARR